MKWNTKLAANLITFKANAIHSRWAGGLSVKCVFESSVCDIPNHIIWPSVEMFVFFDGAFHCDG